MNLPFISFIVPFYNRFALLKEALLSVLNSHYAHTEIILIDDASCVDGLEDLLEFVKQFRNITYIRQERNLGPGAARNRGLNAAKGEWIFFMDSDDVILPDVLPELALFLSKNTDCDIVIFNNYISKLSSRYAQIKQFGDGTIDGVITALENGICTLWNFCFNRVFLNKNNIRCSEAYAFEDWAAVISAWCYSKKSLLFFECFYEYCENAEISLAAEERDFNLESRKVAAGLSEFFNRLISLKAAVDIPSDRKKTIDRLIYKYILHSQWNFDPYKNNVTIKNILNNLRVRIMDFSENFSEEIFVTPCFMGAVNAVALIKEWGGHVAGFIDNNPESARAISFRKAAGLNVYRINEIDILGGGGGRELYLADTHLKYLNSSVLWH
jgi:glycosyltransferase involved in cell wall biosynthesis